MMEADESRGLQLTGWRPRRVDGVVLVQRLAGWRPRGRKSIHLMLPDRRIRGKKAKIFVSHTHLKTYS